MAQLVVDPPQATFFPPDQQTQSVHNMFNSSGARLAVKVKCSDNNQYRLRPVYAFVEPGTAIELMVARLPGPPKQDKLVIQFAAAAPEEQDPSNIFRQAAAFADVQVPLIVMDAAPAAAPPMQELTPEQIAAMQMGEQM